MYFMNCKRDPQQPSSFCSSFVVSFFLIVPTKFDHVSRIEDYADPTFCAYHVHSFAS